MTTTLAIRKDLGSFILVSGESLTLGSSWYRGEVRVKFGALSTRPDPIQRSWAHLEAKWGMNGGPKSPATPPPAPPVKRSALLGWIRRLAPRTPTAPRENRSQQVQR